MLMLNDRLLSSPIVSIQTGGRLGRITGTVIDPRQMRIVAFLCAGPLINIEPAILHSEDVREISDLGLIVDSADSIMPADDLVRLKEILALEFKLLDKMVAEENGHKVGKVASYSVETNTFYIIKLHVRPGLLGSFGTTERIIDRSQIVEVSPQKITVKSALVKEEKPETAKVIPAVQNPFRRPSTQSEVSTNDQA